MATTDKFGMVVGRADATAKLNWFTLFGSYPWSGLHRHGFGLHFASHSPVFVYCCPVLVDTLFVITGGQSRVTSLLAKTVRGFLFTASLSKSHWLFFSPPVFHHLWRKPSWFSFGGAKVRTFLQYGGLSHGFFQHLFCTRCGGCSIFFRVLYRICNPIQLSIRIFNPPTLTLLQVFYCDADCKSLY